mmetsp:Transcript_29920/g.61308  ORF Transcript_29920/g.61308 Transcript_29920/m.61308 type:complete len:559 (-) Transcript_29920:306-1982(-)
MGSWVWHSGSLYHAYEDLSWPPAIPKKKRGRGEERTWNRRAPSPTSPTASLPASPTTDRFKVSVPTLVCVERGGEDRGGKGVSLRRELFVQVGLFGYQAHDELVDVKLLPRHCVALGHDASSRRPQNVLHLHRLHNADLLAVLDVLSRLNRQRDEDARHGRVDEVGGVDHLRREHVLVELVLLRRQHVHRQHSAAKAQVEAAGARAAPGASRGVVLNNTRHPVHLDLEQRLLQLPRIVAHAHTRRHSARIGGHRAHLHYQPAVLVDDARVVRGAVWLTSFVVTGQPLHNDPLVAAASASVKQRGLRCRVVTIARGANLHHLPLRARGLDHCCRRHGVKRLLLVELNPLETVGVLLLDEARGRLGPPETRVAAEVGKEGRVMSEAGGAEDNVAVQGVTHTIDALVTGGAVGHQFADHWIVVRADLGTLPHTTVHAHVALKVERGASLGLAVIEQRASGGQEATERILGVHASFEGPTLDVLCDTLGGEVGRQGLLACDLEHVLDEIDTRHVLGHRVLHLEARVHLEEVEVAVLVGEELNGTGGAIVHGSRQHGCLPAHL